MRSRVVKISPARAAEMLAANTSNRPLSKSTVQGFAEAMRRGDWMVTHQGIAFDTNGMLVDGQHRLAIEGERSTATLAAMVRAVWQFENRPEASWSGGGAAVTNHQIVQTLEAHPRIREFVAVGERIASETG